MMEVTPLDVRKQGEEFKRQVRGYHKDEVDAFLIVAAEALEGSLRENVALRDRIEKREREIRTYRDRERALNDALMAAQELREQARLESERDAAARVSEAEEQARAVVDDAKEAVRAQQERLDDLTDAREQFLGSLGRVVERLDEWLKYDAEKFGRLVTDLGPLVERLSLASPSAADAAASSDADPAGVPDANAAAD